MITVAKYASKEEAYIAKALLEAAEIQAFIDDGTYSDTRMIDIRVPESSAERARSILADQEETIRSAGGNEEVLTGKPAKKREFKDVLLFLKGGALWIFGYVLIALLLRVFGVILPMNPLALGFVFFVGGLIGIIFGASSRRAVNSR